MKISRKLYNELESKLAQGKIKALEETINTQIADAHKLVNDTDKIISKLQQELDEYKFENEELKAKLDKEKLWESRGIHQDREGNYPTEGEYNRQIERCEKLKKLDIEKGEVNFNWLIRLCDEFENKYC
jgi:chromosome segregation ATPase